MIRRVEVERSARAAIMERQTRVRCRAYELYLERGQEPGFDLDDWLQAENEIDECIRTGS